MSLIVKLAAFPWQTMSGEIICSTDTSIILQANQIKKIPFAAYHQNSENKLVEKSKITQGKPFKLVQ